MDRSQVSDEHLLALLSQLTELTRTRSLHWERQLGSAHRYARWKNNLLILGPAAPLDETNVPRYLFLTPFDSPRCLEINSTNETLGHALMELVSVVEESSSAQPPKDPFGISAEELNRIVS